MKHRAGIQVGGTSVIMIFVLLSITVFATLSLISARADARLSGKLADTTTNYYAADSEAEAMLAEIEQRLRDNYRENEEAYRGAYEKVLIELGVRLDGRQASFSVEVSDTQRLDVAIYLPWPVNGGEYFRRTQWMIVPTVLQGEQEEEINLWMPD